MTIAISAPDDLAIAGLADELNAIRLRVKAELGEPDLDHIREVKAYSTAIRERSRQLLMEGSGVGDTLRGALLRAMYTLLEFSEIGHLVLHGAYDDLPDRGEFDSDTWDDWAFHVAPEDWKVMHHQSHHPYANIVGKDHDLGYQFMRVQPGQDWMAHHLLQVAIVVPLLTATQFAVPVVGTTSAIQTDGRSLLAPSSYRHMLAVLRKHVVDEYIREPVAAGRRFLPTLIGNYLGASLGHAAVLFLVAIEHHAIEAEVFHDPGPDETPDEYFARQIRATSNFTGWPRLDGWLASQLSDVAHPAPDFRVFYGALDTHLEHHLFPDLPANRLRELQDEIRAVCDQHGLPYLSSPLHWMVLKTVLRAVAISAPIGEREMSRLSRIVTSPLNMARRVIAGLQYKYLPDAPYLEATKYFNAQAKVAGVRKVAGGQAIEVRLERPAGWHDITWQAGAFISLRAEVGAEELVRQYSLTRNSTGADDFRICIKRVADGRMSNHLNDTVKRGDWVTIVNPPANNGGLVVDELPGKSLFIAGGVGITPIMSIIDQMSRTEPDADATLLYFNRDEPSVIFDRELARIAERTNLRIELVCDNGGRRSRSGHFTTNLLAELVPDVADRQVYVCAPGGLIEAAKTACTELGVPPDSFHTESFVAVTLERPADDGQRFTIRFANSGKTIEINGATTLLEAAREVGIKVPTGCEQGLCRTCVCSKLSGRTQLESDGVEQPRITVCNSLAQSDIELAI